MCYFTHLCHFARLSPIYNLQMFTTYIYLTFYRHSIIKYHNIKEILIRFIHSFCRTVKQWKSIPTLVPFLLYHRALQAKLSGGGLSFSRQSLLFLECCVLYIRNSALTFPCYHKKKKNYLIYYKLNKDQININKQNLIQQQNNSIKLGI